MSSYEERSMWSSFVMASLVYGSTPEKAMEKADKCLEGYKKRFNREEEDGTRGDREPTISGVAKTAESVTSR